jgi:small subunit ribosomal protein S15
LLRKKKSIILPLSFEWDTAIKIKVSMSITSEQKKQIFQEYGGNEHDTGSAESQIALFTQRITDLTKHLNNHRKDFSTQRALLKLVGKRRRLLNYLKRKDIERYRNIVKKLQLRK